MIQRVYLSLLALIGIGYGLQSVQTCMMTLAALALLLCREVHGDVHEQILEVSRKIEKEPANAQLFMKRGELHRYHEDLPAARADLDSAARLDSSLHVVDLMRGRLEQTMGDPKAAIEALDRFLAKEPKHGEARVARARALGRLKDHAGAVAEFTRALALLAEPRPEYYLERAEADVAQGDERMDEAVRGLEEGMKRLGPIVTLQLAAIDLEVRGKKFDTALARIDHCAAASPRKESWLVQRGDILRLAGRHAEAREAFAGALAAIEALPLRHRQTKFTLDLERRARIGLEEAK